MIRGIGVYVDGNPHVRTDGHLTPGLSFTDVDVPVLQKMWDEAREGGSDSFVWMGLRNPTLSELELAARVFDCDDLKIEDAMSIGQRPKHRDAPATACSPCSRCSTTSSPASDVETGQIAVWVGPSFVLSARIGEPGDLTGLRRELEADPQMLALGPLAVLHGILDVVVDGYQDVVDELPTTSRRSRSGSSPRSAPTTPPRSTCSSARTSRCGARSTRCARWPTTAARAAARPAAPPAAVLPRPR